MGAISTIIMHKFPLPIQDIKVKAELDFSSKELSVLDGIIIAALLPLNVSGSKYGYLLSLIFLVTRGHWRSSASAIMPSGLEGQPQ
jgi:hypothetical protein